MLAGLETGNATARRGNALATLCGLGVSYSWRELEPTISAKMLAKARQSLRDYLQGTLEWITRPCFELEWKSFVLALQALGLASSNEAEITTRFLGADPTGRLLSFFKKFPVLAELWSVSISQWCDYVAEILERARVDASAISRQFFAGRPAGAIKEVRLGLSDRHNDGRSVTLVEFEGGPVIYKPRSGAGEAAWFSLVRRMNEHGFRPSLRPARALSREKYYWMEYIEPAACKSARAVSRYYERLGGLIAAAYLLRAVDCHRENLIAAGECPVLVDVDALWHVSAVTKTQSLADRLYRTGFFPNSDPTSLQSRSSALGPASTGTHLPRLDSKIVLPRDYTRQIVTGFRKGWHCLIGTAARRAAFLRQARRVRSHQRRWVYRATESYASIVHASVQPAALISAAARTAMISRLCARESVKRAVVRAEIDALTRLDIPYFLRRTNEPMPLENAAVPAEITNAMRQALSTADKRKPEDA
jgi:lantibiotic modifying enzyme